MDNQVVTPVRHRACYIFAQGTWSATCRACNFTVKETKRSAAAAAFLHHIRAMRLESRADGGDDPGDVVTHVRLREAPAHIRQACQALETPSPQNATHN